VVKTFKCPTSGAAGGAAAVVVVVEGVARGGAGRFLCGRH
jgi:hypothetical protein